ncbi:MAG: hypothetical protein ISS45_13665 [Candidatus Omnitrophica bacterium]|nr:hypothetical protein [Candidatus Omnitrophota bacterium]
MALITEILRDSRDYSFDDSIAVIFIDRCNQVLSSNSNKKEPNFSIPPKWQNRSFNPR